jgi:hypothetical protein
LYEEAKLGKYLKGLGSKRKSVASELAKEEKILLKILETDLKKGKLKM